MELLSTWELRRAFGWQTTSAQPVVETLAEMLYPSVQWVLNL